MGIMIVVDRVQYGHLWCHRGCDGQMNKFKGGGHLVGEGVPRRAQPLANVIRMGQVTRLCDQRSRYCVRGSALPGVSPAGLMESVSTAWEGYALLDKTPVLPRVVAPSNTAGVSMG